jgi:hypothetical protein
MTKAIPYIKQGDNITLVVDSKSYTVNKSTHIGYSKIVDALKAGEWESVRDLLDPKTTLEFYGSGYVSINGNQVFWNNEPFHNALAHRMVEMLQEGFSIDPMIAFMENLMENPSKRSVDQVYTFLEKNNLPITEDGHFLAYKRVTVDYMDCHTRSIDNSIGQTVEMNRNMVDDNPNSYCSSGLHFCSESYLEHFGGNNQPVMILKINPADVVSVPTDYNGAKGRCCKYTVIAQVEGDPKNAFLEAVDQTYDPVRTKLQESAPWPFDTKTDDYTTDYSFNADSLIEDDDFDDIDEDDEVDLIEDSWASNVPSNADYDSEDELYDLVRVSNPDLCEYESMTIEEARARLDKNVRNKKAALKIVRSGTLDEVF